MSNRSQSTKEWYSNKAKQILETFRSQTGRNSETDLLSWLHIHRTTLTANSWRIYRASLAHAFEQSGHHEMGREIRAMGTEKCLPAQSSSRARRKQKSLPLSDHQKIKERLVVSRSQFAEPVGTMLEASRLTGLRPIEWSTAWIDDSDPNEPVLMVRNAKHSNERAHGATRKLRLNGLESSEYRVVQTMVGIGQQNHDDWYKFYQKLQTTLNRITRYLWPRRKKRPSLYAGRHQFSADAKASGLSKIEVAALLGHASVDTAGQHYGRRTAGTGGNAFRIEPDAEDVQKVIDILGAKQQSAPDQSTPNRNVPGPGPDGADLG